MIRMEIALICRFSKWDAIVNIGCFGKGKKELNLGVRRTELLGGIQTASSLTFSQEFFPNKCCLSF